MYYYNFLLFSVGEIRLMCGLGCREIGYGVLGECVFEFVILFEKDFLYIVCFVFEVLELNGFIL